MILWRISRFRDLSGEGGRLFPGRWNFAGTAIVYLTGSAASALLEICVHTPAGDVPPSFTLLKIAGPEVAVEDIGLSSLPSRWVDSVEATQRMGAEWVKGGRTALLRVPSALVPETWNYLLNPLHQDAAKFQIEHVYDYPFDLRLKK
jgi:RES domain-containing protein